MKCSCDTPTGSESRLCFYCRNRREINRDGKAKRPKKKSRKKQKLTRYQIKAESLFSTNIWTMELVAKELKNNNYHYLPLYDLLKLLTENSIFIRDTKGRIK